MSDYKWKNISDAIVERNRWAEVSQCAQKHMREVEPGSGSSKALLCTPVTSPCSCTACCFCTGWDREGTPSSSQAGWQHLLTPLPHSCAAGGWEGSVSGGHCQSDWELPGVERNGSTTFLNNCNEPSWLKIAFLILAQQSKACTECIAENNYFFSIYSFQSLF